MAQGYGVTKNLLLQDNKSPMLMERNGKASSGKRTRHINIWYFFITDRINLKEVQIEAYPIKEMVADFMTKPLQGRLFRRLHDYIMGMTSFKKPKNPRSTSKPVIKKESPVCWRKLGSYDLCPCSNASVD